MKSTLQKFLFFSFFGLPVLQTQAQSFNPFSSDTLNYCRLDSVLLDAGPGFSSYAWSNGQNSQTIWAKNTGSYSVLVSNGGGNEFTDTVFVSLIKYTTDGVQEVFEPFYTEEGCGGGSCQLGSWIQAIDWPVQQFDGQVIWKAPYDGYITNIVCVGTTRVFFKISNPLDENNPFYFVPSYPDSIPIKKNILYTIYMTEAFATTTPPDWVPGSYSGGLCCPTLQITGVKRYYLANGNNYYHCFQDSNMLSIHTPEHYNIHWSTGDTGNTVIIKPIPPNLTTYYFEVANEYASCRDSLHVENFNAAQKIFYKDTLFFCQYQNSGTWKLSADLPGYSQFLWSTGETKPIINLPYNVTGFASYWVTIRGGNGDGCYVTDSAFVYTRENSPQYTLIKAGNYQDSSIWLNQQKPPSILPEPGGSIVITNWDGFDDPTISVNNVIQKFSTCGNFSVYHQYRVLVEGDFRIFHQ